MNRHALDLLQDLEAAGMFNDPQIIKPVQGRYIRTGTVIVNDKTEKMEIGGLTCGVSKITDKGEVRIFVFTKRGAEGPYTLDADEVI